MQWFERDFQSLLLGELGKKKQGGVFRLVLIFGDLSHVFTMYWILRCHWEIAFDIKIQHPGFWFKHSYRPKILQPQHGYSQNLSRWWVVNFLQWLYEDMIRKYLYKTEVMHEQLLTWWCPCRLSLGGAREADVVVMAIVETVVCRSPKRPCSPESITYYHINTITSLSQLFD